jgi:hypothetical protein
MGWMKQREFIFMTRAPWGKSTPGAKAVSHGARFQNVGQLLALALEMVDGRRAVSSRIPPSFLPALQPQANVGSMNFGTSAISGAVLPSS